MLRIETFLTDKCPVVRKMAKAMLALNCPIILEESDRRTADFWRKILFVIKLPNGHYLKVGKDFHFHPKLGWYYTYFFNAVRWTGIGTNNSFDSLYKKIKFIIDDLHAGGKIAWGFWNYNLYKD